MDFKFTDNFEGTLELTKDSYNNLLEIFNLPKEDNEMKNMITVYDIYDIDNHEKILRVYTEVALAIVVVVLAQEMFNMQIQPVLIKAEECE